MGTPLAGWLDQNWWDPDAGDTAAASAAAIRNSPYAGVSVSPSTWEQYTPAINAGIGSVASLLGAGMQSRAANKATQANLLSSREGLAFAREQEAARQAQWQDAVRAWQANRSALLAHLGISE